MTAATQDRTSARGSAWKAALFERPRTAYWHPYLGGAAAGARAVPRVLPHRQRPGRVGRAEPADRVRGGPDRARARRPHALSAQDGRRRQEPAGRLDRPGGVRHAGGRLRLRLVQRAAAGGDQQRARHHHAHALGCRPSWAAPSWAMGRAWRAAAPPARRCRAGRCSRRARGPSCSPSLPAPMPWPISSASCGPRTEAIMPFPTAAWKRCSASR